MDFISQKMMNNTLFMDEVNALYQQIENVVKNGERNSPINNITQEHYEKQANATSTKQYLIQEFLVTCIALTNQARFTNASLSAMLIAQLNNVSKQTITSNLMDENQENLETTAWQIITNSVSVETMLQFNFGTKQIKKKKIKKNRLAQPYTAPEAYEPSPLLYKKPKEESDSDIQELKFIQAKHQKLLDKFSKNISLIWFSHHNSNTPIPKRYLSILKQQLFQFNHYKKDIKFTLLTDYKTFKNNTNNLIMLIKNYGTRFEIQFVEDISFQDREIEKVHQTFLQHKIEEDIKKSSQFYQVAFNLEHSISPSLRHNAYFSFQQLYELSQETAWDKLKRMFHFEKSKLITLLDKIFSRQESTSVNGNNYLYIPDLDIKTTILSTNYD